MLKGKEALATGPVSHWAVLESRFNRTRSPVTSGKSLEFTDDSDQQREWREPSSIPAVSCRKHGVIGTLEPSDRAGLPARTQKLPGGVTVTLVTLAHTFKVRILAG
jgi:hypothetical protein